MKPKTMILMVVAIVCGLGASYMTSRLLAEREDKPTEAPVVEKVTLLVAKKNIEMHTALKKKPEDFFQPKQFTKEDAPKDALTEDDFAKLKDKYLKRGLRKGDHVQAEDLMDNASPLRNLPNGMRAIGIPVNAAMSASGFANLPGSHVDIFWTARGNSDKETFAKALLEDVIVLAADTNENQTGGGGAVIASVVTVSLHPDDALKLTLAMETGSLRLVLRNLEDRSSAERGRFNKDELLKDGSSKKKTDVATGPDGIPEIRKPYEPPPVVAEETPKKPEAVEQPKVKLTRMTVSLRNGSDVRVINYWINEQDEIVANPDERDTAAPPSAADKKDAKKGHDF